MIIVMMSILLVGCIQPKSSNDQVGTYVLIDIEDKSLTEEDKKDIDLSKYSSLELNEDGTGKLTILDEVKEIKWQEGLIEEEKGTYIYTYQDNTITISKDDTTLTYQKN